MLQSEQLIQTEKIFKHYFVKTPQGQIKNAQIHFQKIANSTFIYEFLMTIEDGINQSQMYT